MTFRCLPALLVSALVACATDVPLEDDGGDDAAIAALRPDTAVVYAVQGVASGRCLHAGDAIELRTCDGSAAQRVGLVAVGGDRFRVTVAGRCLAVLGASTVVGAAAALADCDGSAGQEWTFTSTNGAVRLKARHSGLVLSADGGGLVQVASRGDDAQRFRLLPDGDGGGDDGDDGGGNDGGGNDGGGSQVVAETVVVAAGQVFDGGGRRFTAGPALGDGSQDEGQLPVFRLEPGATLRNVVLGAPAADGVHTRGDALVENVVWEDIGEDALTVKGSGRVEIRGGSAQDGDDKVFQINAPATLVVTGFTARRAGKFIRQNGGTTFRVDLVIERCDISDMAEAIARTDSPVSTVTMTDSRFHAIGRAPFIGFADGNVRTSGNQEY